MKYALKILAAFTMPFIVRGQFFPAAPPVLPDPVSFEIDGYTAKVNERVITRGEVREAMASMLPEIYRQFQGARLNEELKKAFVRVREELIEHMLIMESFLAKGGRIPEPYVEDEIDRVINNRFQGDEVLFEQVLAEQKKTREEYKEKVRERMAVGIMFSEEISRRIRITPKQIHEEYTQNKDAYFIPKKVKYSLIVLNKGVSSEYRAAKRKEAQRIREKLLDGAEFGAVAREFSEGNRAAEDGAFPWMQFKDVHPEFRNALESLPVGEISEIIETSSQLCMLKVEGRHPASYKTFDEVRQEIENSLKEKEREELKKKWIKRLKETNYVVTYD